MLFSDSKSENVEFRKDELNKSLRSKYVIFNPFSDIILKCFISWIYLDYQFNSLDKLYNTINKKEKLISVQNRNLINLIH